MSGSDKKEFGDYQTPIDFATKVCIYLRDVLMIHPKVIVEPTCGVGAFIKASLDIFEDVDKAYGIEINPEYVRICRDNYNDSKVTIINDNFFSFDTKSLTLNEDNILVVGNPPWVTNSDLNFNLPQKMNFKNLSGMDAITGGSNFDICEYMILKLIKEYEGTSTTIAMLCKTSVARNVILELNRNDKSVEYIKILNFNANKVFGIGASACLLVVKLSSVENNNIECTVSDIDNPQEIIDILKVQNGVLSSSINEVEDLEGECEFVWRQGVKHDCAGIMELTKNAKGNYVNKNKDEISIEDTLVFPLLKSSMFKKPIMADGFNKFVIVTQKKARQETKYIETQAPKTWEYLTQNKDLFDKRKSSIYNGAPAFSMFGVGDYSYAKYKVGVSGFYKKALFCLVYNGSALSKSVMGDDTSYFLAFDNIDEAYTCMVLLNSKKVQEFLFSISFQDAKRPYTKKVLQRISLRKAVDVVSIDELTETEQELGIPARITSEMYESFKNAVSTYQIKMELE